MSALNVQLPFALNTTIDHFARFTDIFACAPMRAYRNSLVKEASRRGLPLMRPLSMHFSSEDENLLLLQESYMYGPDFLISPVLRPNSTSVRVYLPPRSGSWMHLVR